MKFALVAHRAGDTNLALARAGWLGMSGSILTPAEAIEYLEQGDVALGRLDVRRTLDGVEPGLRLLNRLEAQGVLVLNPPSALLASHDKLLTARRLRLALVPHPATSYVTPDGAEEHADELSLTPPVVVKPRYGSWGYGIRLCNDAAEFAACLESLHAEPWFRRQGALVQELVPPLGFDMRLVVAGGEVIGAIRRVARAGEWRTNVALGAVRKRVRPDPMAEALALAAADAVGGDLVGVDLLPTGEGSYVVLEVNGAVDFTPAYSLGGDVFAAATDALARTAAARFAVAPAPLT